MSEFYSNEVGRVVGEPTTTIAPFLSKIPPRTGEYVILRYDGIEVLGMVEYVVRGNAALTGEIYDVDVIDKIRVLDKGRNEYVRGVIKILGDAKNFRIPRIPPPPGTKIYKADSTLLEKIFGKKGSRCIKIGRLLSHEDVSVYLDANMMVTRHLAILAITGAGKSNTVAVLSRELSKIGATLVIFDMHADYVKSDFDRLNSFEPRINPYYMSLGELGHLLRLDSRAHKQERIFRLAYKVAKEAVEGNRTSVSPARFVDVIKYVVYRVATGEPPSDMSDLDEVEDLEIYKKVTDTLKGFKDSAYNLLSRIEDFEERLKGIIDPLSPDALMLLKRGYINVVDLSRFDEEDADVIVSHYLRRILYERKRARLNEQVVESMAAPVFLILEEAHILAPKDRSTLSKHWIGRIAREGRKFGVGLCLVSQRPKGLDPDALSQVNNMIILKLVEPSDQRHVQQASEQLSEDLLQQLPSLNVGEAIIIGPMTPLPVMVKIDKFEGRLGGSDINVVDEWSRGHMEEEGSLDDLVG